MSFFSSSLLLYCHSEKTLRATETVSPCVRSYHIYICITSVFMFNELITKIAIVGGSSFIAAIVHSSYVSFWRRKAAFHMFVQTFWKTRKTMKSIKQANVMPHFPFSLHSSNITTWIRVPLYLPLSRSSTACNVNGWWSRTDYNSVAI